MILMYHKVHPNVYNEWWVDVNNFYRQMHEIKNKHVVYLEEYNPENPLHVVITFDGVYKNVLTYALPILRKFNYKFELFVTSDYIGKNNEFDTGQPIAEFCNEEDLATLVNYGGRLQWHTKSHINLKEVFDTSTILNELEIPGFIKNIDKNGFSWFAYPHGEFNQDVYKFVSQNFKGAVSCYQGNNEDIFALNRLTVLNETKLIRRTIGCIISSFNYGQFLAESIESVLSQTILPDQIIISDDCSYDDTKEIAELFQSKFPNIIQFNRNDKNLGIVDHFNKVVNMLNTDYVFILGADNRIPSNYVEELSQILDNDYSVSVAYTDYFLFGERAKNMYDNCIDERKGIIVLDLVYKIVFPKYNNLYELQNNIELGNFIHGSSMYRKKDFLEIGGYIKSTDAEDFNFFLRLIRKGNMALKCDNTHLEYRQHSESQANNLVYLYKKIQLLSEENKRLLVILNSDKYKLLRFTSKYYFKLRNKLKSIYKR